MIAGDDGIVAGQEGGDDGMRCPVCGFVNLVGADICEVAPVYDPTGQTALNAANLLFEMLCVIADSRVNHASR